MVKSTLAARLRLWLGLEFGLAVLVTGRAYGQEALPSPATKLQVAPDFGELPQQGAAAPGSGVTAADAGLGRVPEDPPESGDPRDRYVRGFRREHNFALSFGLARGAWLVDHFGNDASNSTSPGAGPVIGKTFPSDAVWVKFQYAYHLPIYHGFGYVLGSSAGYFYETVGKHDIFQPVPAVQFPGVLAGLVLNVDPALRIMTAFDTYLERLNEISIHPPGHPESDESISITMVAYDTGLFLDWFYNLNWGVRLEAHERFLYYYRPLHQPGDTAHYPVDAVLRQRDYWAGIGLVYHLL